MMEPQIQESFDKSEIIDVHWLTLEEIKKVSVRPAVVEAIEDYLAGKRLPLSTVTFVV